MIEVGTCGFSYRDWRGVFYPENISDRDMLEYYASQFDIVEIDFTYYRMPGVKAIEGLSRKTPEDFCFCVKAPRSMTHEVADGSDEVSEVFQTFRRAMEPLVDQGKMGCILCQFPWSFKRTRENSDYIQRLPELLPDIPIVVEFRNVEWVSQSTFDLLKAGGMGFCCVDEPKLRGLVPPLAVYTSPIAYIRFHGRNASKWWKHSEAWERYDYLYSHDELLEWVPKIARLAEATEQTFVLFNNCHAGQAAVNAKNMLSLLDMA